jgi:ion channel POLLUX/CASTOR
MECFLAGTHADSKGLGRLLGFSTTIGGMLIFALMIGVVSDSIGASVDSLKKGNAKVLRLASHPILSLEADFYWL